MTKLVNSPANFADEAIAGFAAAHQKYVRVVPGGVVRSTVSPRGQVAIVLGGGSGHYPAFAGWVGPGFAHGAACGNIFASPASSQVYSVAKLADNGGGIILGFGNYAGDVLHFGQAAERLRAEGHDVRIVAITDDIASAPPSETARRRGIAGDLTVFKIMAAAAEAGLDIDQVEQVGANANAATRSIGIAFDGCTLPGADKPLFTVPAGRMAIGLGIHGEPGIDDQPTVTADQLADLLVDGVLAEQPTIGANGYQGRVTLLLNGLGTVKYEELFVAYRRVAENLSKQGLEIVAPEVGELVTSLDMCGVSLTITFLNPALEKYWTAAADTPAFHRGAIDDRPRRIDLPPVASAHAVPQGSRTSQAAAVVLSSLIAVARDVVLENETRLGDMDAVAGDGDHGIGMARGTTAAAEAADTARLAGGGAGAVLTAAGDAWSARAGGTSGALWGAALTTMGGVLGDHETVGSPQLVASIRAGIDAITTLGGAEVGDKTLVDAAIPFIDALSGGTADGLNLPDAWKSAAHASSEAADATADITARRGRARTHGDRSLGTPDPGAISFALIVTAIGEELVRLPSATKTST